MVLCSPEKSRGEGLSKKQKVAELPPSGEASVQDTMVGLLDEVKQLWGGWWWCSGNITSSISMHVE